MGELVYVAWELSLVNFIWLRLGVFAFFRLGTFALDLWLGNFSLETSTWGLSLGNLRILSLGNLRILSLVNFRILSEGRSLPC